MTEIPASQRRILQAADDHGWYVASRVPAWREYTWRPLYDGSRRYVRVRFDSRGRVVQVAFGPRGRTLAIADAVIADTVIADTVIADAVIAELARPTGTGLPTPAAPTGKGPDDEDPT